MVRVKSPLVLVLVPAAASGSVGRKEAVSTGPARTANAARKAKKRRGSPRGAGVRSAGSGEWGSPAGCCVLTLTDPWQRIRAVRVGLGRGFALGRD